MSILDDIRSLDPNDPGRWPLPVRAGCVALCFVLLAAGSFWYFVWSEQKPKLEAAETEERELREQFKVKHSKAVNLEVYQAQLADIERSFGALLRQLPGKTEVQSLLIDISQVGVGAGLEEKLFQPASSENTKDFYAELPIKIRLTGTYHQMGEFVSGIAALPRIVTLHDITIKPENKDVYDSLSLELTAKTFRYLDDSEVAAAEKAKADENNKNKKGKKGKSADKAGKASE
jgi:type IV pilus assembly protein PilO